MSTQTLPMPVKQTHQESLLSSRHLSYPSASSAPFRCSVQAGDSLTANSSSPFTLLSRRTLSADLTSSTAVHCVGVLEQKIMSWRDGYSAAPSTLPHSCLQNRRVPTLARSVSAADLESKTKSRPELPALQLPCLSARAPRPQCVGVNEKHDGEVTNELREHPQTKARLATAHHRQHSIANPSDEITADEKKIRRRIRYKSYQDLHILSMYQDNSSISISSSSSTRSPSFQFFEDEDESTSRDDSVHSGSSSQESLPMPDTPIDATAIKRQLTSEGTIVKPQLSRRANARQVQIIEHHQEQEYLFDDDLGEIVPVGFLCTRNLLDEANCLQMQATVLTVPGRPRLIQIHRPQHLDLSRVDTASTHFVCEPSTPKHYKHETSKFIPYDTPMSEGTVSNASRTVSEATPIARIENRLDTKTDPVRARQAQLTPPERRSSAPRNKQYQGQHLPQQLDDPFGSPISQSPNDAITSSVFTHKRRPTLMRSFTQDTISGSGNSTLNNMRQQETYDTTLNSTISSTIKAFDAMAFDGFYLHSPELTPFRTERLGSSIDTTLVANLRKIFPQGSQSSLSTLAAWLVVDQHFTNVFDSAPKEPLDWTDDYDCDLIGLDWTSASSFCRKKPATQTLQIPASESFNTPDLFSSPLSSISIPSKARSILGMGVQTDPLGCKPRPFTASSTLRHEATPSTAENHTKSAHASVQSMGRKLVRDLTISSPSLENTGRQRSLRTKTLRGRNSTRNSADITGGSAMEDVVNGMWEACRCIVSML